MRYEDMTPQEWLQQLARQPEVVNALRGVFEAALANTEAVILWRGHIYGPGPRSQQDQQDRSRKMEETRKALDEAVDAYRNAKLKGRVMAAIERAPLDKLEGVAAIGRRY